MNKEKQKEFTRRIAQANKTELTVIVYDIILEEISDARAAHIFGDIDAYRLAMKRAQRYLCELMTTLDFSYGIAVNLMRLYEYVQRVLVKCDIAGITDNLDSAENVIKGLRSSFAAIAPSDKTGPVMYNTEPVYAGLTYGKGDLNETDLSTNSRGFLA